VKRTRYLSALVLGMLAALASVATVFGSGTQGPFPK